MWKDVIGYEGLYEVSCFGSVRSLDRYITNKNGSKVRKMGISMKLSTDRLGYKYVKLCNSGVCKKHKVHRLVAYSFIGNCDDLQINHKNGKKDDNYFKNLEICTAKHNNNHAIATGLRSIKKGSACGSSKLVEAQVLEISKLLQNTKEKIKDIAVTYDISPTTVSDIDKGRSWKHLFSNFPLRKKSK